MSRLPNLFNVFHLCPLPSDLGQLLQDLKPVVLDPIHFLYDGGLFLQKEMLFVTAFCLPFTLRSFIVGGPSDY